MLILLFFFSSRRRHTRLVSDWSSDVCSSDLILYDEPTSGLDPVVADSINRLIRRLQQRLGVTSVVVTHDMKSAFDVANHISYLHEGRIYFHGTPIQLQQAADPILQDFLLGRSDGRGD